MHRYTHMLMNQFNSYQRRHQWCQLKSFQQRKHKFDHKKINHDQQLNLVKIVEPEEPDVLIITSLEKQSFIFDKLKPFRYYPDINFNVKYDHTFYHKSTTFDYNDARQKLYDEPIIENDDDIEKNITSDPRIKRCKICGNTCGTFNIIYHFYGCKYHKSCKNVEIRFSISDLNMKYPDPHTVYHVGQRQVATSTTEYPILGTFGAGPCIIVAMRDPDTQKTMLAHIDELTTSPLSQFFGYFSDSKHVDVYLCGGDNSSKEHSFKLLQQLSSAPKYNVVFCHLIDIKSNSFAINANTGDIYVNNLSPHISFVVTPNLSDTIGFMSFMFPSGLRNVTAH